MPRFFPFVLILPAALVGFLCGAFINGAPHSEPISVSADVRPAIPVVILKGLDGPFVMGSVTGTARVMIADALVVVASGSFRLPAGSAFTQRTDATPAGMRFVASRRGKKYYPVGSAGASHLSPANRVYFPTADAAKQAGFHP